MNKYIYTLLFAAALGGIKPALAQNAPYETLVDGVKVIVQPSGNNIVEIQTVFKGGVQNYPAAKMGIESLSMSALTECGTAKYDKNTFKNTLDKVSASIYGSSIKDYSVVEMSCLKGDLDTVWPLYDDAITHPRFDTAEFRRIKQDAITNLRAGESNPANAINSLSESVAFAGRDYAKKPEGTADIISTLTAAETKAFYNSILTRSHMLIVVVADLDRADIEARVKQMLDGVKKGNPVELKTSFFRVYKNSFVAEQKAYATNYIQGVTSGPELDAPDFNAFNIAMQIFTNRHFLEVRTNNGLSYAPQAAFTQGAISVAKFRVSTTQPDKYIAVFDKLVDSTKRHGFTADELADMKVTYLTHFYMKNETNEAQASSIVSNEILHGDWKRSMDLIKDVKKVTLQDIDNAFNKYIGNTVWVYQGDTKKVNPVLYINGTLHNADNPVSQ